MSSVFISSEKRRQLLYKLMECGFKVRMHSYEYFIRGRKFVCILVLSPFWNSARLHLIPWNLEESKAAVEIVSEILLEIEHGIKVEVIG